jgi:hypothetical protein
MTPSYFGKGLSSVYPKVLEGTRRDSQRPKELYASENADSTTANQKLIWQEIL